MMARLPVQAAAGVIRRLFHSSSNSEALKRIASTTEKSPSCISCVLWPLAHPLLGHAAIGWAGTAGHAYHRGGSKSADEDQGSGKPCSSTSSSSSSSKADEGSSSSKGRGRRGSSSSSSSPAEAPTQQFRDLQQALQQDLQPDSYSDRGGLNPNEAQQLPEHVARIAMRDPLGVLISSLGVPLGISLKVNRSEVLQQHAEDSRRTALDDFDLQGIMSSSNADADADDEQDSSSDPWADAAEPSMSVPDTDMQQLRQELHVTTRRMARRLRQQSSSTEAAQGAAAEAAAKAEPAAGPATLHQQLESIRAMIRANADKDRWGTTQQSPAEIAQQVADANRAAGSGGGDGSGGDGEGGEGGDDDEPLSLRPGEERYADAANVGAELKELDEIFEVLAKVPWLDDEDVEERELRGLAAVGLLGTLEEVGWTIRDKVLALWAGERDEAVLSAGLGPREATAISSILYHTQQLEEQYGRPPQQSVDAALAAANLGRDGAAEGSEKS